MKKVVLSLPEAVTTQLRHRQMLSHLDLARTDQGPPYSRQSKRVTSCDKNADCALKLFVPLLFVFTVVLTR
jgi:hypothetical protein